jgi:1,5-anhydro-D-fructose reductase (1,5-anhydro-D-mannitol-forming)
MIRIAMLSGWHVHAKGYAQEANRLPDAQVSAVWDEDARRGQEWANELGVDFEGDLDGVLAREDVDAVIVCTPTDMHREVIIKAARAGKHIFTEKVMALTTADCLAMARAIDEAGVRFAISFPHRTMSHNLFAKQAVEAGWLGKVTLARVRNAHDGVSGGWLPPHFFDAKTCGGGAMMDLGAHPMYLLAWLLGRPVSVSSLFTQVASHYPDIEDNAVSLLEFEGGVIGVSETGFVSKNSPFELEIYGTEGSLFVGGPEGIRLYRNDGDVSGFLHPDRLPRELPPAMTQWADAIEGRGEILFGVKDGILLTEIMEAAYRSQREKRRVEL